MEVGEVEVVGQIPGEEGANSAPSSMDKRHIISIIGVSLHLDREAYFL